MQSKKRSLVESIVAVIIGMAYAVPLNYAMINHMTWSSPLMQSVSITVLFTIISLTLKYVLRRTFNWLDVKYPTAHFASGGDIGSITHGFLSTKDGLFVIDLVNDRIEIIGGPELPPDHLDDPCDPFYPKPDPNDWDEDEEDHSCPTCGFERY